MVISLGNSTLLFWKIGTIHFFSERLDVNQNFYAMYYILRVFWLAVTPAFNYLIQFTVRKTCIDYDGLRMSRRATFHCIAIWVFNWNSKWLTTTSWKSNNGWTSSYRRWVNFSVIRSWSEVYCSFYFPICGTGVMTQRNPTATWKTWSKRENRKSCSELPPVFMTFFMLTEPHM